MRRSRLPSVTISRRCLIGAALLATLPSALSARAALPRILIFGDSLTAGHGLPEGAGLVPVLSRWLVRHGRPAILLNAGLSGETTKGGRDRIDDVLPVGADAVIVQLGGNDIVSGVPVRQAEANLDAILSRARQGDRPVLLVGIRTPTDHPASGEWAALWPRLARRHDCLVLPDLYGSFGLDTAQNRARFLQPDHSHASAEGVRRFTEDLGPKVVELLDRLPAY